MKALFITKEFFTKFGDINSITDRIRLPNFCPIDFIHCPHDDPPDKSKLVYKEFRYSGHCYVDCIGDNLVIYSQV